MVLLSKEAKSVTKRVSLSEKRKDGAVSIHLTVSAIFTKGNNFCDPVCFPGQCSPFKIGSTLKRKEFAPRKNLRLGKQILFFGK